MGMKTVFILTAVIAPSVLLLAQVADPIPPSAPPPPAAREEVGISSIDGITISGKDALVTRNGVTSRVTDEIQLTNGTRVRPDGTIVLSNGTPLSLKATQVLTFAGEVREVPVRPNPVRAAATSIAVPATPDGVVVYNGVPYFVHNGRASIIDAKLIPPGQILLADGQLAPLPASSIDFPPVDVPKGTPQQTRIGEPGTKAPSGRDSTSGNGPIRRGFRRE